MPSSTDRILLDEAPVGIFEVGENGQFTDVNRTACELVGYTREELLELSLQDLDPSHDGYSKLGERFDADTRSRTRSETTLTHKEGHQVDVIADGVPVQDRTIIYAQEITERTIFSEGPAIVFKWEDASGWPITSVSENVESVLGYTVDELQSDELVFEDLVHDEDIDRVEQAMAEYDDEGTDMFSPEPYRVLTADGDTRWVMEYTKPTQEAGGESYLLGYLVDITERKEREQHLETYQLLFEQTNDCIVRIEGRDGEPVVRDVNEAFEKTFGYDRAELVGESLDDFIVPDGFEDEAQRLNHRVVEEDYIEVEVTRMADDGLRDFLLRSAYYEENAGYILYTDITEHKEREKEIQAQNDRLQALFENAQAGIAEYVFENGRAVVLDVNDQFEELFGYDRGDIVGESLDAYITPPDDGFTADSVNEEIKRGEFRPREVKRQTADGVKTFLLRNARIDVDDKIRGYASYTDITERKEYERELEAREQKYRNLFEDTRDALMLIDRDGYIDCNERALELFGVESVDAFLEHTPWDLSPSTQHDGSDSKTAALDRIEQAFEDGEAFFEWTHQRLDGTDFPAEVKLSRFEHQGEPVIHALVRNISDRKAQQEKLAAERNRIRAITNAIPDVTIVYDSEGVYKDVLTGQEELLVDEPSELIGANARDVLDSEVAETTIEGIRTSLETGTVQTIEYSLDVAGERTWFEGRIAPMPGGERDEVVLLARDITERKQHEQELEAREQKYRNLFEDTRDALMLLDRDGFHDCNEQALDLFGVESTEDFVQYAPWDLSPDRQPDGRNSKEAAREYIETAFEEGRAFFEWTHQRIGGTDFAAEVKLSRFQHEGEPRIHALVRNITERKEYESALEEAREELRQVIDLVPDPLFVKDRAGRYLLANDATATVYGTTVEELEGAREADIIPNVADSEEFRKDDIAVIDSGEPRTVTEELTTAEGDRRIYQTTRIPFDSVETDETVVLGYARDITDLKAYERELESQRDYLEVLNQVVRHDIRNDLQLVLAYGGTVADYVDEEAQEYVDQVLAAARDAVDITTTARDITEVMLQSDVDPDAVYLPSVLEDEIDAVRSNYDRAVVRLDGSLPSVKVPGDDMLASVFRNLLTNAIQHNDKDVPEITISATNDDERVEIAVADNGPGIPDERKTDVFAQGEMGFASEGTGLGLYLVKTLVDQYDGDVWVEDNDPEGACFVVELPIES